MNINFTDKELHAIAHMLHILAHWCREDLPGAMLYTGAFKLLEVDGERGSACCDLADKIEQIPVDVELLNIGYQPSCTTAMPTVVKRRTQDSTK